MYLYRIPQVILWFSFALLSLLMAKLVSHAIALLLMGSAKIFSTFPIQMRRHRFRAILYLPILFCATLSPILCSAQIAQPEASVPSSPLTDVAAIVAKAKGAFAPTVSVSQIALSGQAHLIQGSLDQRGSVRLVAGTDGSYRIDYDIPNGPKAETQTSFLPDQTCSWTDSSGTDHSMAQHNCLTGMAWFLPTLAMLGGQQPPTTSLSSSGSSLQNGVDTINLRQSGAFNSKHSSSLMTHLSTVDLFLSPQTYLPATATFAVHPDNNANVDIPVRVTYSDYRQVSGISVPFHIQRFLNGTLFLDITIDTATAQ